MVLSEYYKTRTDGVELARTWSSRGMMIERDGVRYAEAIDPTHLRREYTETEEPIEQEEMPEEGIPPDM